MVSTFRVSRRRVATAILSFAIAACSGGTVPDPGSDPATETFAPVLSVDLTQMTKMSYALYIQDVVVGTGVTANAGSTIAVNYSGFLVDGTRFATNADAGAFSFVLGTRYVIDGWELGLVGMKVGGTRRLVIGSALGFGPNGQGTVPPKSTLVYYVELVSSQ
jgi:FKBP-type peptidyl-prolyl cis-trans isomerase FkpA